jgi:uncharacterized membrane protein HdeD (DUF308 family)
MTRLVTRTADRIAPWRDADWRVLILEGILLAFGGAYLLVDSERAEFVFGLIVGGTLVVDGVRQWHLGFRRLDRGRLRDLTLIRGAVGVVVGLLVIGLSIAGQITVVGIRGTLGAGALAYGLLGLAVAASSIRGRRASWTSVGFEVLLVVVGILLLYQVAVSDSISILLAVTGWVIVGSGIALIAVGVLRRPGPAQAEEQHATEPDPHSTE